MKITEDFSGRDSVQELHQELRVFANAAGSVIHIRTREIVRCVLAVREAALVSDCSVKEWDVVHGFRDFTLANSGQLGLNGDGSVDLASALGAALDQHFKAVDLDTDTTSAGVSVKPEGTQEPDFRYFVYVNPQDQMENNPMATHMLDEMCHVLPAGGVRVVLITPDILLPGAYPDNIMTTTFNPPGLRELREGLDAILEDIYKNYEGHVDTLAGEDRDVICSSAAGMSKDAFQAWVSSAMVRSTADDHTVTLDDIRTGIAKGKTEIVKKNDLLELYTPEQMSSVGGMENLKSWVDERVNCFSDEAAEFGIEPPKGVVVVGVPGCLSGDTVIQYKRGARPSSRNIVLREMYYKFNGLRMPGAKKGKATPWRDITLPTYLHSLTPEGTIAYNRVISVIEAGEKTVKALALSDGTSLRLTAEHPVAMADYSFRPASELREGDEVLLRGSMLPNNTGGKKLDARPPRRIVNLKYHKYGSKKEVDYYQYTRVAYARLVIEAHMNSMPVDEFIHILKNNRKAATLLKFLEPRYEVHHVDEDTTNDALDNLMVYTKEEHAKIHGANENFNVEYVRNATVVSLTDLPNKEMTYDIQMDLPSNNFVANGVVVHNTGKSLVAKAIASRFGVPLLRLDFGRVFNSLVGSSEQRIRTALSMVETMAPCILFVDEIDKGLGGIGSGGDAGTSSRVLGTFLTWLNDTTAPVFTVVTANNITGLPPELLRRGRFDNIFATGLPNTDERAEVVKIHLSKRGWDMDDQSTRLIANACKGYVPAEIESGIKDALISAFSKGEEELTVKRVITSLNEIVPLSVSHKEAILSTTVWAKKNAVSASREYEDPADSADNVSRITKTTTRPRVRIKPKDIKPNGPTKH